METEDQARRRKHEKGGKQYYKLDVEAQKMDKEKRKEEKQERRGKTRGMEGKEEAERKLKRKRSLNR